MVGGGVAVMAIGCPLNCMNDVIERACLHAFGHPVGEGHCFGTQDGVNGRMGGENGAQVMRQRIQRDADARGAVVGFGTRVRG